MNSRVTHKPASVADLVGFIVSEPTRFTFPGPRYGGPTLGDLRRAVAPLGTAVRLSGTGLEIHADVDPGAPEAPVVALDMIARSDASGLERAVLSALLLVDEINIGIDGRSDAETLETAKLYADNVWTFNAQDLGMTPEQWEADKIHFSNARNKGRRQVKAPWTLFLDTDEKITISDDLRALAKSAPENTVAFAVEVYMLDTQARNRDGQRFALTEFHWERGTHNLLQIQGGTGDSKVRIEHDVSLRSKTEFSRRTKQRRDASDDLYEDAKKGDISALWHVAKQRLGDGDLDGVKMAEEFRLKAEPFSIHAAERGWIAIGCSILYYNRADFINANIWAIRSLMDGPRVDAFAFLGDIAEADGRIVDAVCWYGAACGMPVVEEQLAFDRFVEVRFDRYAALKKQVEAKGLTKG